MRKEKLMQHKCFISFKTEDMNYKNKIKYNLGIDMIDKSLNEPINSNNEDYIMRVIRTDHLKDSTVTIFLIGDHSAENNYLENQNYIKRELQASLYEIPNGILGIVLPSMYEQIYLGTYICSKCGRLHNNIGINDDTVIKEFSSNYYIKSYKVCAWPPEDRYCILTKWDEFIKNPEHYIEEAYRKRDEPVSKKITVFPK